MASLEERTKKFEEKIKKAAKGDVIVRSYTNNNTTATLYFPSCGHESLWHPRNQITKKGIECQTCYPTKSYHIPKPGESFGDEYPDLAKEWSDKNDRTAYDVKPKSGYEAIFNCIHCNSSYARRVANRVRGDSCDKCLGGQSLKDLFPDIAKEYIIEKNEKPPEQVHPYSSSFNIIWKCSLCSGEWPSTVYARTKNEESCPNCSNISGVSYPELQIYKMVSSRFPEAEHQPTDIPGIYHVDILLRNKKIAIEVDGFSSHLERESKDLEKNRKLNDLEYTVIRIRDFRLPWIDEKWDVQVDMSSRNKNRWAEIHNRLSTKINEAIGEELTSDQYKPIDYQNLLQEFMSTRSLAAKHPKIAALFDRDRALNPTVPERISPGSEKKYFWKCQICNHSWKKSPYKMINSKIGCPKCSSAGTKYPELLTIWDSKNNKGKSLYDYLPESTARVKWICTLCEESYSSPIRNVASNKNKFCNYCYNEQHKKNMSIILKEYMELEEENKRELAESFIKSAQLKHYNNCCPKCDSKEYRPNGHPVTEQRYKCSTCGYHFTKKTTYSRFGIKQPEKLPLFLKLILEQETVKVLAKSLEISTATVVNWKKIFSEFLKNPSN
ncbi:zinc-ribbon domain-containing protein [Bacillus mycoides]|uniref:zinc-ribbon domain-containing protein n=1 Tax=Bacillus mycoides TaxID=1405 RepID=UPI001F137561|nr:zinc-ribbon domain-containing protein [Bacillus mycoides]